MKALIWFLTELSPSAKSIYSKIKIDSLILQVKIVIPNDAHGLKAIFKEVVTKSSDPLSDPTNDNKTLWVVKIPDKKLVIIAPNGEKQWSKILKIVLIIVFRRDEITN